MGGAVGRAPNYNAPAGVHRACWTSLNKSAAPSELDMPQELVVAGKSIVYSDLDNRMGQFNSDLIVTNRDAINVALENIFSTSPGSRWWIVDMGANLRSFLFHPLNETTALLILMHSHNIIARFEKRVELIIPSSSVTPNYADDSYDIEFVYRYDVSNIGNFTRKLV